MKDTEISQHRLVSQKLHNTMTRNTPQEIVHHLGAIQAQDYAMAKWAIGSRCHASEKNIEEAIDAAKIMRTHILRPTWHFVAAEDIYWLLDISGPQVKRIVIAYLKKYGFDVEKLNRINASIEKILAGNNYLTRDEIMLALNIKPTTGESGLGGPIMMYAELEGLVCNGRMRGKQSTYALLAERVVKPNNLLSREEALAKLAKRYFESHGPATLLDFSWWSGFSPTTCKLVICSIQSELNSVDIHNQTYWFGTPFIHEDYFRKSIHFLPAFDEILIAYKTREVSILREHQSKAFTHNGIFKPIILDNGKVIGTWKKIIKKDLIKIETQFFSEIKTARKTALLKGIQSYENYLGTAVVIE